MVDEQVSENRDGLDGRMMSGSAVCGTGVRTGPFCLYHVGKSFGLGFNLSRHHADEGGMSDVDAIRSMASEHDLQFVDLDTYGVDPAAREILPADLARRHHVVAIKRKFGTPVIATADPDDLAAQDDVRGAIGRDFISVVASKDQISHYLDQLLGPADDAPGEAGGSDPTSVGEDSAASVAESDVVEMAEAALSDEGGLDPGDVESGEGAGAVDGDADGQEGDRLENAQVNGGETLTDQADEMASESGGAPGSDAEAGPVDVTHGIESPPEAGEDPVGTIPVGFEESSFDLAVHQPETAVDEVQAAPPPPPPPPPLVDDILTLEPSTSLLPEFGSDATLGSPPLPNNVLAATVEELEELARSVQDGSVAPDADSTALAADLVAEAVATYQEQQGELEPPDSLESDVPSETSLFPPLAKALVEGARVSLEDMESVLEEHLQTGQSVARILTAQNLVTEADLMWGMAQEMGLEFVDLDTYPLDLAEAGMIPEATARHHNVMVLASEDGVPVVAASNPTDVFAMDDLRTIMGRSFKVVVATRTQITAYIGRAFNSGTDAADMAMEASLGLDGQSSEGGVDDIQAVTEEAPIVRYVNLLILQALNERASDIHIEPTETDLRIRYRIDGVLHDVSKAPRTIAPAVTTRLKVMADMNIAEHRVPQDGRISLNVGSKGIDLRMATLPTIYGEKVVMRVLDKSSVVLGFADLGFDERLLTTYEGLYTKPYGTILVTGPTGSGKSTTLYTTLTALNSPEKNIITVEDPVELPLKGVNQVQLNIKAGLNFASALRAILRSDPDIVLVGEIRDKETAVIAVEAALTGHMVLATLHTNDAASTPMRLIEMGLEPFLVTSAVSGVMAQRLARRLCVHCKEPYEPTESEIMGAGWSLAEVEELGGISKVYRAVGCSACSNTGYRGRKALAELLPMSEEIEKIIIEGGSVDEIHRVAVAQGMSTLRQSGLTKAMEGETTLEEVLRVVA
jgi:type IV pilus assembly protein PilB